MANNLTAWYFQDSFLDEHCSYCLENQVNLLKTAKTLNTLWINDGILNYSFENIYFAYIFTKNRMIRSFIVRLMLLFVRYTLKARA